MCGSCLGFWGDAYLDPTGRAKQTTDGVGENEANSGGGGGGVAGVAERCFIFCF